jgi:hypothetical protein
MCQYVSFISQITTEVDIKIFGDTPAPELLLYYTRTVFFSEVHQLPWQGNLIGIESLAGI